VKSQIKSPRITRATCTNFVFKSLTFNKGTFKIIYDTTTAPPPPPCRVTFLKLLFCKTGTLVTPSSNLQLKKLRLGLICLLRKFCFCHINCDSFRWAERLLFANSCRHVWNEEERIVFLKKFQCSLFLRITTLLDLSQLYYWRTNALIHTFIWKHNVYKQSEMQLMWHFVDPIPLDCHVFFELALITFKGKSFLTKKFNFKVDLQRPTTGGPYFVVTNVQSGVNFINILRLAFSCESVMQNFSVLTVCVCIFWWKEIGKKLRVKCLWYWLEAKLLSSPSPSINLSSFPILTFSRTFQITAQRLI